MVTAAHPRATPAGLTVQLMTPTPRQTAHERTQAVPTIRKSWITAVTSSARRYSVSTLAAILIKYDVTGAVAAVVVVTQRLLEIWIPAAIGAATSWFLRTPDSAPNSTTQETHHSSGL